MTMTEIRKAYEERKEMFRRMGLGELIETVETEQATIETLWKEGTTDTFTGDFLAWANGYQITTGDDGIRILQTLNLHRISATKAAVKALATFILEH